MSRKILFKKSLLILVSLLSVFSMLIVVPKSWAAEDKNVRLLGHCDLQGRVALQIVLKGNFAYVGHHRGEGSLLYVAYFNAGLRVVDIADPFLPKGVRYYVPEPPPKTKGAKGTIQTNDVGLDYRGLIYITDRAGAGLHVLEYQGGK